MECMDSGLDTLTVFRYCDHAVSQSFVGVHWLLMESVSKDWTQINKKLIGNKAKPSGHLKLWLKNGGFRCLRMSLRSRI